MPLRAEVVLSNEEREVLERWARRPTSAQALALRCRIVLACAAGLTNQAAAQRLGISDATVGKWRSGFVARRLDGLGNEPRPAAPRTISDADVETGHRDHPGAGADDATHWSTP